MRMEQEKRMTKSRREMAGEEGEEEEEVAFFLTT